MIALWLILVGMVAFAAGAFVLGLWLRRHPSKENAERSSRVMHLLFFASLVGPALLGMFWPGLGKFDGLLGVAPLPARGLFVGLGVVLMMPGVYLLAVTNSRLRALGSGANAFRLTKRIVETDIYERTRNPMSLGFYLAALGASLVSGSATAMLGTLLGLIPAHLLFLKYFEEQELELRFGESYRAYRANTPFLLPRLAGRHSDESTKEAR